MSCNCKKKFEVSCVFGKGTGTWWGKSEACYVCHCYNKEKMLDHPPEFASSIRLPTKDDVVDPLVPMEEQLIDADYLCVRSCFCNEKCPFYQKMV